MSFERILDDTPADSTRRSLMHYGVRNLDSDGAETIREVSEKR